MTLTTACFSKTLSLWHSLRLVSLTSHRYNTHYGSLLWHPVVFTLTMVRFCDSRPYYTHYGLFLWHPIGLFLWPPVITTLTTAYCYDIPSFRHSLRLVLWPPVITTLTTDYCYDIPSLWHSLRLVLCPPIITTLTTAYCYDIPSFRHSLRLIFLGNSDRRLWTQNLYTKQQRTVRVQQAVRKLLDLLLSRRVGATELCSRSVICWNENWGTDFILQFQTDSLKNFSVLPSLIVWPWR